MVLKHVTPLVKLKNQNKDLSVPATWCTRTDGGATAEGQPMAATYGSFRTNSGVNGEAEDSNAFASVASHGLQIGENQDSGRYWTNTLLGGCMSYVTPLASAVLSGQLANVKVSKCKYVQLGIRGGVQLIARVRGLAIIHFGLSLRVSASCLSGLPLASP